MWAVDSRLSEDDSFSEYVDSRVCGCRPRCGLGRGGGQCSSTFGFPCGVNAGLIADDRDQYISPHQMSWGLTPTFTFYIPLQNR